MVAWDSRKGKWSRLPYEEMVESGEIEDDAVSRSRGFLARFISHTFVPEGVTSDYFRYTKWRCFQRLVSAMVNVFGTQAMLLALGIRTRGALGTAAAVSWVLKDALGKLCRIFWASRMSRKFDADAKRWRYRSSILYAMGNGLEIVTYIFPAAFLAIATVANCLKQISMLTSSATRNTIYRSFADGNNNIGEISACGEAQIAVVDLVGIAIGINLSKALGTDPTSIALAYLALQSTDVFAIYREIRSVIFRGLNLERTMMILREFVASQTVLSPNVVAQKEHIFRGPMTTHRSVFTTVSDVTFPVSEGSCSSSSVASDDPLAIPQGRSTDGATGHTATGPAAAVGGDGGSPGVPSEVHQSISPFMDDKFAVIVDHSGTEPTPMILVHKKARSPDIFQALHVFVHLERILLDRAPVSTTATRQEAALSSSKKKKKGQQLSWSLSCEEAVALAEEARTKAMSTHGYLLEKMEGEEWETGRYMYNVPKRIEWKRRKGDLRLQQQQQQGSMVVVGEEAIGGEGAGGEKDSVTI